VNKNSLEIKETVSENNSTRGRPPVLNKELETLYENIGLFINVQTRKSRINIYYRQRAISVLMEGQEQGKNLEFCFLADKAKIGAGTKKAWKPIILYELGKIQDPETMKTVARRICELKPSSKEAVSMIRRFRNGNPKPACVFQLNKEITATINNYIQRHQDITNEQILESLKLTLEAVNYSELNKN